MNEIRKTDIMVPSKCSSMCLDTYLTGAETFSGGFWTIVIRYRGNLLASKMLIHLTKLYNANQLVCPIPPAPIKMTDGWIFINTH